MKIVHIESGLGNQMLSYAEYLVMKKNNPEDDCYIETIIYDIPECNEVICQWNGYELKRIFGIEAPNIKDIFDETSWKQIISQIRKSRFWDNNWDYPQVIVDALNEIGGYHIINTKGHFYGMEKKKIIRRCLDNKFGYFLRRKLRPLYQEEYIEMNSTRSKIFIKTEMDIYAGQFLGLSHKRSGIEFIEDELKQAFTFPDIEDQVNLNLANEIEHSNSVAIHCRRGDALLYNNYLYRYGYFKRAVKYIKRHVENPRFYFFSDPGSIDWCKHNLKEFELMEGKDFIRFVDWNYGNESFRDMQLMAMCRHNIISFSSFGWWSCYLNQNPDKITISPNIWQDTTVTL